MMNILGSTDGLESNEPPDPKVHLHLYNKAPAPLRKIGHLNVSASSESELLVSLGELHKRLYGSSAEADGFPAVAESEPGE
jgi:5-(carboxyamino)imidazole ribonucleotide synthase